MANQARQFAASVVGWLIAAIVVVILLRFALGTIGFLFRSLLIVVVLIGMAWLYVKLKGDPDD